MHRYGVTNSREHVFIHALRMMMIAVFVGAVVAGCAPKDEGAPADGDTTAAATGEATADMDPVKKGGYLVNVGGCNDCHTPLAMGEQGPAPDMSKMLSGSPAGVTLPPLEVKPPYMFAGSSTAFRGPWGVSYAFNLTPDSTTGLGSWTEDNFVQTLKSGKHWGSGRPIMPPMPWQNLSQLPDDDLKAIFAYLRSIPAISNKVPDYEAPAGAPPGTAPTTGGAPAGAEGGAPADTAK